MSLKRRLSTLALSLLLMVSAAPAARASFTDAQSSWAAEVIDKAAAYGLMEGCPDGRFGVGEDMTRAQFAAVLCRLFAWEPVEAPDEAPSDVSGHWARGYVSAAALHGVLDAAAPFRPDDPISRLEMAVMLVRALGYDSLARSLSRTDLALPFDDVPENDGYAAIAYDFGILTGVEGPAGALKFLPDDSATREQCAAMLVRCYERYRSRTDFLHGFYAFSSYSQLSLAGEMDAVSVGWAQLQELDGVLTVNQTAAGGSGWARPEGAAEVLSFLEENAVPCHLNVFASASTFASVADSHAQARAVDLLVSAAQGFSGLTIDFEGLRSDRREDFTAFLTLLRAALPAERKLYVCVQPDAWFGGYDYRALGDLCDKVILMAHDYQWAEIPEDYLGTDNTHCPVTPFAQVYTALRRFTDPAAGVQDRSKAALAISFNTTGFHVDENGLLLDRTFYHPLPETIARRLTQPDAVRVWDEVERNPRLSYAAEDGERYLLWYEDAQSVEEKLRLARMFGVTGASVWRLGLIPAYDDAPHYNVWSVLSK